MKILFLHGWRSIVGGVKPTYLSNLGHLVINPALDDDDFDAAIASAQREYDLHRPDVVVGSSRGAAVALHLHSDATPLVLLCPAWKNWGTFKRLKSQALILHSRYDDVIPFSDSEELVANSDLPPEVLIEVGRDHRLADDASLSVMLWACNLLSSGEEMPGLGESPPSTNSPNHSHAKSMAEANYICDACGEEIIIPLDLTEGSNQTFVEDCPVCCRANTIHIRMDEDENFQVWAEPEQDHDGTY